MKINKGPKTLIIDIETSPIEANVWGLYDQNIALNQVKRDWQIISWAAKWLNEKKVMQKDMRTSSDEAMLLLPIWYLLDKADIVVTQNGKSFDIKKLNAKFLEVGLAPPSSFQQIDTKLLAKKHFAFTSNSLEYMSNKFNTKYRKLKHKLFPGMELWTECMNGNLKAWKEMARYNKYDVLATEELYKKLVPWGVPVNFNVYYPETTCSCGSKDFSKNGYNYTSSGKYQRFECKDCGAELKSKQNLIKNKDLKRGVNR